MKLGNTAARSPSLKPAASSNPVVDRTRAECRRDDTGATQFVTQTFGVRQHECFGRPVGGLAGYREEAGQ